MPYRILEYEIEIMKSAIDIRKVKNKEYKLPLVIPIVLYTGKKKWDAKRYLEESQETLDGVKNYISQTEEDIESVTNLRQKYRNKLRNCTDDNLIKEYKTKRDECTTMLNKYRKNLKIANYILEDTPKVKEVIKIEMQMKN